MASLIPGFEYDIFISYRQKDNKHDGWVTEFVNQLKGELEATFKEDISIYFDENPSDGLLETHSVDKSLENKLKCLIFIPIISQTYCDAKSFAWQYEFCAFNKLAKEDQFGRDIKLTSGNVASRILPVKIHDLDLEDKALLENELGGFIRGIEFIYKEPGVNRPLKPEDDEKKNLNNTMYCNQINKVANAVKEIITALKKQSQHKEEVIKQDFEAKPAHKKNLKTKIIIGSLVLLALAVLGYFIVPKLFKPKEQLEKSIAVLPFKSLSDDPDKQYLADGMMEAILLHLSKIKDLRVLGSTSVEQYRQTRKTIQTIGRELNVEYVLEGNSQKFGDNARLIVQLIRTRKESHVWSNEYNRNWNDILTVQSEVAQAIAGELHAVITPDEKMIIEATPTSSLNAYDYYLRGKDYQKRSHSEKDIRYAIQMYEKAVEIDPNFALACAGMAACSRDLYWYGFDKSEENLLITKKYLDKALSLSPKLKEVRIEEARYYYHCKLDYPKSLEILEKLKTEYPNDDEIYSWIGYVYRRMGEFRKSLENNEHAISLNPSDWDYWANAAQTMSVLREYMNAENYYKRAIDLNPSNPDIYSLLLEKYINTGQIQKAKELLTANEKFFSPQIVILSRGLLEFLARNYDKAIQITQSLSEDAIISQNNYYAKHLQLGLMYRTIPDNDMAMRHFEFERDSLLKKINELKDDQRLYRSLGLAYAGLGMKEEALQAGEKALEILNLSKDAFGGFYPEMDMVRILIMVAEYDKALTKLNQIMAHNGSITVEILKLDPFWDPVRNNEKFKEIISNPAYQVSLSK